MAARSEHRHLQMDRRPSRGEGAFAIVILIAMLLVMSVGLFRGCVQTADGGQPPRPLGVKPTPAMIRLGAELFREKSLSADGTVACITCHDPAKGWADGTPVAVGIRGQKGKFNSPSILNAAYSPLMFWDGRTVGTATQALLPLENRIEMGPRGNEAAAVLRLAADPKYANRFRAAFGTAPTAESLGLAIAAFETTVVSQDVPAARRLAGNHTALSPEAEIGYRLFKAARCVRCHKPPLFTDFSLANNGMSHGRGDLGRQDVTGRRSDARRFKVPSLIGVARTAPYGHDGRLPTLAAVLEHYNRGGRRRASDGNDYIDENIDSRIQPLKLTATQLRYFEIFLREGFEPRYYPRMPSR